MWSTVFRVTRSREYCKRDRRPTPTGPFRHHERRAPSTAGTDGITQRARGDLARQVSIRPSCALVVPTTARQAARDGSGSSSPVRHVAGAAGNRGRWVRSDERGHNGRRCRRTDAPHRFARRGRKGKEETTRVRSRTAPLVTIANDETLRLESPRARPCPEGTLPLLPQPLPSTPDDRSVCIKELRGGGAPCYGKTRSDEPGHTHTKRGGEPARTAPLVLAHRAVHMNVTTLEIVWWISLSEPPSEAFATRQMETVCTGPCDSGEKANDLPAPRRAPTRSPAGTPACPRRSPSPPRSLHATRPPR